MGIQLVNQLSFVLWGIKSTRHIWQQIARSLTATKYFLITGLEKQKGFNRLWNGTLGWDLGCLLLLYYYSIRYFIIW